MGNYVLYLLTQAFVAMIFAYFSATLVFKERKLYMLLVSLGFYMLMGSALMEIWGDRAGWTVSGIGLNAALVATSVATFGTSALLREAQDMENGEQMTQIAKGFLGLSVLMALLLATSSDLSGLIVDEASVMAADISGAYSHLGQSGWALGSTLFIGGMLLAWMGARRIMVRREIEGLWLMSSGGLYLLWPFDIWINELPMAPVILILAMTSTYFGFELPKEEDDKDGQGAPESSGKDGDGGDVTDEEDDGPAPWVMKAIAAREAENTPEVEEDLDDEGPEKQDEGPPLDDEGPKDL